MTGVIALAATLVAAVISPTSEIPAAQSTCTWQRQVLTLPAGATQSKVTGTDQAGGYSGSAYFDGSGWRILYWKNGQVIDYGSSGFGNDEVVGQNRRGTIAGTSLKGPWGAQRIAFRIRDGQRQILPQLAGAELRTRAIGVADNDDVYGNASVWKDQGYVTVAVRWPHDRPDVVERVPGVPEGQGLVDVDHDGTLMVGSGTYPWPQLLRDGQITRLSEPPNLQHGYATVITDGLVGGSLRVGSDSNRAAYWDRDGVPHWLPGNSEAVQLNKNGLIVAALTAAPYQIWRFGTLEAEIDDSEVYAVDTIGDDDSVGGTARQGGSLLAAVWRCR